MIMFEYQSVFIDHHVLQYQKVGMGQVQNGCLYIRYRSSSMKTKLEEFKELTGKISCYSIAICILYVLLIFLKVEKTKT